MFKKDKVQSLVVPRFKELKVKEIWDKIKDFDEYNLYFPDFPNSKLPERDYLISIISSINSDATVENEYANKFKKKDGVRRMKQNIFIKLFI